MSDTPDEGPPPSRWEVELEFVQSLANPMYVNYLAQSKYLEDESFLRYLAYLEYWRKPQNAKFLVYPGCLHMLTLLKQALFRQEIAKVEVAKMVMDDFYHAWATVDNRGEGEEPSEIKEDKEAIPNGH